MKSKVAVGALALMLFQQASAFSKIEMQNKKSLELGATDSRREFISKSVGAAVAATSGLGQGVLAPLPAKAFGGLDKANAKLRE